MPNKNLDYFEAFVWPFCKKDCLFCNEWWFWEREFISLEKFTDLINNNNFKKIVLTGWEPLLNPNIEKYIKVCKSKNIFVSIVTAFEKSFSNEKLHELIKLWLDELMISLEWPEKIHDLLVREKWAYKNIMTNLFFLKNINREQLRVIIHSNINKVNHKSLSFFINKILNNFPFIFTYHIQMLEPYWNAFKNKKILFDKYSNLLKLFFNNFDSINLKNKIKFWRLPFCIVPEKYHFLISETPEIYENNDWNIEKWWYINTKYENIKCNKCNKNKICDKFFKYYIELYWASEIKPF
jgi:MoaA/NifB/PqqE/SkfB family radical SAM enzyme